MLSPEEEEYFIKVASDILKDELFLSQKKFVQHHDNSIYEHEVKTARLCYEYALRNHCKVDYPSLIRGALLHDFFLYDWHQKEGRKRLHGYRHPNIALKNARQRFHLNQIEMDMIQTHMWPLTFFHFPHYQEGWILTLMDKKETLHEMFPGKEHEDEKDTHQ